MAVVGKSFYRRSFQATAAIRENRFVQMAAGQLIKESRAQADITLGASTDAIAADAHGEVVVMGTVFVTSQTAIASGARVSHGNDGMAKPAGAGDQVVGVAFSATSGAGELVEVLLHAG